MSAQAALVRALQDGQCPAPPPRDAPGPVPLHWQLLWLLPLFPAAGQLLLQLLRPLAILCLLPACLRSRKKLAVGALAVLLATAAVDDELRRSVGLPYLTPGPDVHEGVYFAKTARNEAIARAAQLADKVAYRPPPYLFTGDFTTLLPLLAFDYPDRTYERFWVQNEADGERLAMDWAFPASGFDAQKPILLMLHGVNGDSQAGYLKDLIDRAEERGWTSVVMVARGYGGTPRSSPNHFSGARVSDVATAAAAVARAAPGTPLIAVGFSMGGAIMNNYIAQAGAESPVTAAVTFSGTFDAVRNRQYAYSERTWLPMIAMELKKNFYSWVDVLRKKGGSEWAMHTAFDMHAFDEAVYVPVHGYADLDAYYEDMSANRKGRLNGISVPLLAIHACDDPIIDVNTIPVGASEQVENVFFLITRNGGHLGWPQGLDPTEKKFGFMSEAVLDFGEAAVVA